ncbi:uncharacterized protein LOC128213303 [Mya arenaria]|uniref:uncharacterized protein LOC128213303 n=1 Tax=Mya arenaria TaxID=6604 RepID=UPI0022E0D456|nr:uncharacterized protein LOC128213303 [Mya arenaria]
MAGGWLRVVQKVFMAIFSLTHAINGLGNGVVLPKDPYIYIGNILTLMCNLTTYEPGDYDSQNLFFSRRNDEIIASTYITIESTRSIVLRYPIRSSEDGGNYLCKLNRRNNRPEIIGNQFVVVEYEPQPVTDVNCRVYNWQNMTCTWDLGVKYVHPDTIDVSLIWTIDSTQSVCPHPTKTSCSWWEVDEENSFMSDLPYYMGVIVTNKRTGIRYPESVPGQSVDTNRIVEPTPVQDLAAEKNTTCIMLSWKHRKIRRDKVYKLDFKSEHDMYWQTKHLDSARKITLCGLSPHTLYNFSVQCIPRLLTGEVKGFWSKPAYIAVRTETGIPKKSPVIASGSYMETACQHFNCKKVHIYWKPLTTLEANGNVSFYKVDFQNLRTGLGWDSSRVTTSEISLMFIKSDPYQVQIRAATSKGVADVFSNMFIPGNDFKPSVPDHRVEAGNSSVTVYWDFPEDMTSPYWHNLTSFTVFWCTGFVGDLRCEKPIEFKDVSITERSLDVFTADLKSHIFGVAVNALSKSGKFISSGFKWNSCMYRKNAEPEVAPMNIRLSAYQPDDSLSIEWERLSCDDSVSYIVSYHINICPTRGGYNCTGEVNTFTVPNTFSSYTAEGLDIGTRYKVWVNAVSEAGSGPNSETVYGVVINRSLTKGEIAGIVIGGLIVFIIFLVGIVLCTRHVYASLKKRYQYPEPIDIPITLPPLPDVPIFEEESQGSDDSDGIYEKIIDDPPSPVSSTMSTTGVDAPLLNSTVKHGILKGYIYDVKEQPSDDSGRGSETHSADTLLTRLHPSHLKKHKKLSETDPVSNSDSGVMLDGRGQTCTFKTVNEELKKSIMNGNVYNFDERGGKGKLDNVTPYSAVDIVEKSMKQFAGTRSKGDADIGLNKGSTLSLPIHRLVDSSQTLDVRTRSAENDLDISRHVGSVKGVKESGSCKDCIDCVLNSSGETDQGSNEMSSNPDPSSIILRSSDGSRSNGSHGDNGSCHSDDINSYIRVGKNNNLSRKSGLINPACNCGCHRNCVVPVAGGDGYVAQAVMVGHEEENCHCRVKEQIKAYSFENGLDFADEMKVRILADVIKNSNRPDSQVCNLPPHFFDSLSALPVDPTRTTEL